MAATTASNGFEEVTENRSISTFRIMPAPFNSSCLKSSSQEVWCFESGLAELRPPPERISQRAESAFAIASHFERIKFCSRQSRSLPSRGLGRPHRQDQWR